MKSSMRAVRLAATDSFLLLGAVVAAAQVAVPDSVTPQRVLEGSDLFNSGSCTRCHAPGGRGQGWNGPDLSDDVWLHGGDYESILRELNTRLHPESWNVWDSLAEGYARRATARRRSSSTRPGPEFDRFFDPRGHSMRKLARAIAKDPGKQRQDQPTGETRRRSHSITA